MFNLLFILFYIFSPLAHPIHVSMTNIEYNSKEKKYDIIFKVFTDDFDNNIKALYKTSLNTEKTDENKEYEIIVSKYFNQFFKVKFDNKIYKLTYISKKSNFESTWLNFTIKPLKINQKKIEITNNIMNQYYKDQTNLVIFTQNKFQKAFSMNIKDTLINYTINK